MIAEPKYAIFLVHNVPVRFRHAAKIIFQESSFSAEKRDAL